MHLFIYLISISYKSTPK